MQQPAKGHSCHVMPITASPACVSPSGVAWPRRQGHGADPPSDAAAGPPIVRRFLPPWRRPRGRQHREEDKQPLIWAPQAASLFPSAPAPTAPGMAVRPLALPGRGWAARHTSGGIPQGDQAGSGGRGGACPQRRAGMPAEGMRGSGASRAPSVCEEGSGLQHYVRSDKGAQLGRPGRSDKGTVIFVLQEREKKIKRKKERKSTLCFSSRPPSPSLRCSRDQGAGTVPPWLPRGSGTGGGNSWVFGSRSKALGREQRPGVPSWGVRGWGGSGGTGCPMRQAAPLQHPGIRLCRLSTCVTSWPVSARVRNGDGPHAANLRGGCHPPSHRWLLDHVEVASGLR